MRLVKCNNRGFTLTEVIVSIAIVSIVVLAVSSTFLTLRRIERQQVARENIISEVRNIYHIFSSDPTGFKALIKEVYDDAAEIEEQMVVIKFNSLFQPDASGSFEIKCNYESVDNKYTLRIELPDSYRTLLKEAALTRVIKVS